MQRPELFFSEAGTMPEREVLTFSVPAGFSPQAFRAAVSARVAKVEEGAAKRLRAQGLGFMGARRVQKQRHTDRPASGEPRRGLDPQVAAADKWKRIEALGRLAEFQAAYREALAALRAGARRVVFPRGTYLLRVHLGLACTAA